MKLKNYLETNSIVKITPNLLKTDAKLLILINQAYLFSQFNLKYDQPHQTLVPTLGLRINYILNVKDIFQSLQSGDFFDDAQKITAVDIGCGASCILPLLVSKFLPQCKLLATECNDINYTSAKQNIESNNLESKINCN